jgi:hypothetical protein
MAAAADDGWDVMRATREDGGLTLWIAQLHLDCMHTGFEAEWMNDALITALTHQQWQNTVAAAVRKRESARWRRIITTHTHPAVYRQVQTNQQLTEASYLRVPTHGWNDQRLRGRQVMTALRCGSARMRVYTGEWVKESMDMRICCTCAAAGSCDDERHFLLHCPYYAAERAALFTSIDTLITCSRSSSSSSSSSSTSSAPFHLAAAASDEQLRILMCAQSSCTTGLTAAAQLQLHSLLLVHVARCWRKREEWLSIS